MPQPAGAQIRIEALDEQQQRMVAASLDQIGIPFQICNATLDATVPGAEVATVAARWRAHAATRSMGSELVAAWERLRDL